MAHRMRIAAISVIGAAALALMGCSSPGSDAPADGSFAPITIGHSPIAQNAAAIIADRQGFYADHGLEVTLQPLNGGAALVPALQSDSVQVGGSNLLSILQGVQQGVDVKCLTGAFHGSNADKLIGAPGSAPITSGKDLEGKTVGINTIGNINQLVVMNWVAENGGDPKAVTFVAVNFPDMLSALQSGSVDAVQSTEPFTTQYLQEGLPVIADFPIEATGDDLTFSCWAVTGAWYDAHPEQAAAVVAAIEDANAWAAANPEEFRTMLVTEFSMAPEIAADITLPALTTDIAESDLRTWMDTAVEHGLLSGPVDLSRALVAD